jgi:hypothetical protein
MASSSPVLIVPGKQVGKLRLQSYPKGLPLGNPDYSDAAMNHETMLWKYDGKTLLVESTNNAVIDNGGPGYTVHYIRTTSPRYRDRHGLRTGSTFGEIKRSYPHLKSWDNKPVVLADNHLGIAFEFNSAHPAARSKCVAVAVYEPGGVWAQLDALDVLDLEKSK